MRQLPSALDREIAAEKAAALGRSGRRLRAALDKLRKFESGAPSRRRGTTEAVTRAELLAQAGEAYWGYIVQREALGLYHNESVVEEFGIPAEVRRRMGPRLRKPLAD